MSHFPLPKNMFFCFMKLFQQLHFVFPHSYETFRSAFSFLDCTICWKTLTLQNNTFMQWEKKICVPMRAKFLLNYFLGLRWWNKTEKSNDLNYRITMSILKFLKKANEIEYVPSYFCLLGKNYNYAKLNQVVTLSI